MDRFLYGKEELEQNFGLGGTTVESMNIIGDEGLSAEAITTCSDTQIDGSTAESLENVISETERSQLKNKMSLGII